MRDHRDGLRGRTHSVANGARLVATGRCDVVIAGSSEAAMTPTGIAGFANMTALSTQRRLQAVRRQP